MRMEQLQENAAVYNARRVRKMLSREDPWRFRLLDAASGKGLPHGEFTLFQGDFLLVSAAPDEEGWVSMPMPKPGVYRVKQTLCAPGYRALSLDTALTVDELGDAFIEKENAENFRFYNIPCRKRLILERGSHDAQEAPPLVVLCRDGRRMDVAIPDAAGTVRLPLPEPGAYTLTEQDTLDGGANIRWACALAVGCQGTVCLQRMDRGGEPVVRARVR